jgi:predicted MPP superfamily phosphohydrolase
MATAGEGFPRAHTKIAQLSDLHCNASQSWSDCFDVVHDLLLKERPDAVLITGDCVDHPRRGYFKALNNRLTSLQNDLTQARGEPALVVAIPGNHDYNFFGNHLWSWQSRRPMRDELGAFLAEDFKTDLADFARTHGVMLFPFDSNSTSLGMFARGRVHDPHRRFRELDKEYRSRLACQQRWGNCVRVALLHHHPLPLPDTRAGQKLEAFHILDNANEFLRAACDFGVDLILHGHKHVSGIAEYRYGAGASRPHGVYVSACGTSAKVSAPVREVCLFDIFRSGSVFLKRARCRDGEAVFRIEDHSDASQRVVAYSERRKLRVRQEHPWSLGPSRIKWVGSKTKVVRIIENGRGYVKVTLDGLRWSSEVPKPSQVYKEYIHGGIGRVAGGWYRYLDGQGHGQSDLTKIETSSAQIRSTVTTFDQLPVELPEPGAHDLEPRRFELRYLLHNGYFTSARDFFESYYDQRDTFCEEASTIEVLGPTEMAELIVTFPPRYLPPEENIRLEAWILPSGQPLFDERVIRGNYDLDKEETDFINRKGAIRYRRELNQVSVMIRHPQPGRAYTLRWSLARKNKASRPQIPALHLEYARLLSELTDARHAQLEALIRQALERLDLRVSVAVYEPPSPSRGIGQMTIVQPHPRLSTLVGRGVLGQAFRTRQLQYRNKRGGEEAAEAETFHDTDQDVLSGEAIEWGDDVVCEPLNNGPIELLVIPLIADDNKINANSPVAGALIISRGSGGQVSDFFPFDLAQPEDCRKAEEWLRPLVGIVETAIGWLPQSE